MRDSRHRSDEQRLSSRGCRQAPPKRSSCCRFGILVVFVVITIGLLRACDGRSTPFSGLSDCEFVCDRSRSLLSPSFDSRCGHLVIASLSLQSAYPDPYVLTSRRVVPTPELAVCIRAWVTFFALRFFPCSSSATLCRTMGSSKRFWTGTRVRDGQGRLTATLVRYRRCLHSGRSTLAPHHLRPHPFRSQWPYFWRGPRVGKYFRPHRALVSPALDARSLVDGRDVPVLGRGTSKLLSCSEPL